MNGDKNAPVCTEKNLHTDSINGVKNNLPADGTLTDLAGVFKLFGDPTRIKILYCLFESELCVCDLAEILGMTVSAVSHQLRLLKAGRLVKYRKEGKSVIYSLDDEHVGLILAKGMEHIVE